MLPADDRCFVRHEKALFEPATLRAVLAHFEAVEAERQRAVRDETDAARVAIGASTAAMRFDPVWYDPWRGKPGTLIARVRPFTWVTFPVHIRHVRTGSHLVPWHQDAGYMRLLKRRHAQVVTCFLPLELEPARHSTLEFALGAFAELRHGDTDGHKAGIQDLAPGPRARFDLAFGDALVFGDLAPHRTVAPVADDKIDRRSFEYRLVRPEDALPGKDYFDIERGIFVRTDGSTREFPA